VLIRAFGLFWSADEVEWFPGPGRRYMLLGRRGERFPNLQVADFRTQSGLYILYGDYGPYYVGRANRLGGRLKRHLIDRHAGRWNRFSWFGFQGVLSRRGVDGLSPLQQLRTRTRGSMDTQIGELEALLIRALGLENNYAKMRFPVGRAWTQVRVDEADKYLARLARV
jgi:hypothetical protein